MQSPELVFPPLLNGIAVDAGIDTAQVAVAGVVAGNAGAGDLYWSQSEDRLNMAVVLEPDVVLSSAAQMLHVMAVAFGDAFGAVAPPELAVHYRWPGDLLVNGAKAGSVRLIAPQSVAFDAVPAWMVLSLDVAVTLDLSVVNPGETPDSTTLHDEGAGEVTSRGLIGSVSRHFLTWVDTWTHDGFKPVHENWSGRAAGTDEDTSISHGAEIFTGQVAGMDEDGNLLFRQTNADMTRSLALLDVIERSAN